jgi:hypothetical protein
VLVKDFSKRRIQFLMETIKNESSPTVLCHKFCIFLYHGT